MVVGPVIRVAVQLPPLAVVHLQLGVVLLHDVADEGRLATVRRLVARAGRRPGGLEPVGEDAPDDEGDALGGPDAVRGEREEDGGGVPEPALLGLLLVERDAHLHPAVPVRAGVVLLGVEPLDAGACYCLGWVVGCGVRLCDGMTWNVRDTYTHRQMDKQHNKMIHAHANTNTHRRWPGWWAGAGRTRRS